MNPMLPLSVPGYEWGPETMPSAGTMSDITFGISVTTGAFALSPSPLSLELGITSLATGTLSWAFGKIENLQINASGTPVNYYDTGNGTIYLYDRDWNWAGQIGGDNDHNPAPSTNLNIDLVSVTSSTTNGSGDSAAAARAAYWHSMGINPDYARGGKYYDDGMAVFAGMTPGPAIPFYNFAQEGPNGEMVLYGGGGNSDTVWGSKPIILR